ncbi:MAG: hypothetical protein WD489_05675 [Rhodovibrionaceae bacterium]
MPASPSLKRWLAALALLTPVILLYLAHYLLLPEGLFAHGFLQYDQPYYLANAREHFDAGFSLLYRLPFSPNYDSPALYFQPLSLVLGSILQLTKIDPGLLSVLSGLLFALLCIRLAIALYEMLFGLESFAQRFCLLLFVWGGGLFTLGGIAYMLWKGDSDPNKLLVLDPFGGWWFLNFGRNLVLGTEAFYHLLTFALLIALLRKRYVATALLCLLLSASHPYTGLQIALAVLAWALFERYFLMRAEGPPRWFAPAIAAILAFHLFYYLGVLSTSPEHALTVEVWRRKIPGLLDVIPMVCAYALVGGMALLRLRDKVLAGAALIEAHNRLFVFYFLVSFALANHEFLIPAHQPIHFTRGHIWTPLFLLGAPVLIAFTGRIWLWFRPALRWSALSVLAALFLLDNAVFIGLNIAANARGETNAPKITLEERALLQQLDDPRFTGYLAVSANADLGYLATVYTPLRSWTSHRVNAPSDDENLEDIEAWLHEGEIQPDWRSRNVIYIVPRDRAPYADLPWVESDMEILETPADYVLIVDRNRTP